MRTSTSRKKQDQFVPRRCHRCYGTGFAPCPVCGGSGKLMKGSDANGHPTFGRCDGCYGRKSTRCPTCHGEHFV